MQPFRVCALVASLVLLPPAVADQRPYLNLDFETATRGRLWSWSIGSGSYEYTIDDSVAQSGAQSLRARFKAGQFGSSAAQILPAGLAAGKHVRFSGYIKTEGITEGGAGLWLRADGAAGTISIDNAPTDVTNGTTDWQRFVIDRDISPEATRVVWGAFQFGNGTAWFDNFSLEIDGAAVAQAPAPYTGEPTAAQLDWLNRTAHPFTTEMAGNGFDDLAPVAEMVGEAHIVGLGEGTHGSAEFFRMKHRLLEYLATTHGFTIFSIEANMPEAYALNDYVLNGIGNPRALIKGMYFWTWSTQEVLDMVEWMRRFNLSGRGRVQFTGFDMQFGGVAMEIARSFVARADPGYLATLNPLYAAAATVQSNYSRGASQSSAAIVAASDGMARVVRYLSDHRADYLTSFSAEMVDWAIQNARVGQQATSIALGGTAYRDQCMAENIDWILQQNPGAKIVLWAHDYHVSRAKGAMGSYLAAAHGKDYVVFGQVFHGGRYTAVNNGRLVGNDAVPSFPGTIEYVLHATGTPRLLLDLREASAGKSRSSAQRRGKGGASFDSGSDSAYDPATAWLLGPAQYRTIGSMATDGFQFTDQLTTDYDVLIFFDHVSASALLPWPRSLLKNRPP